MENKTLKIYLFYCSNSLDARELSQCRDELKDHHLKEISLPCSGKLDIPYLVKAFETGADGVLIITCEIGQCRHLEGNMRAEKRSEAVNSLLEEIGAGTGRIAVIHVNFYTRINQLKPALATQGR
jgi:coenzyme F420-reducing hydrogenase delta subunit